MLHGRPIGKVGKRGCRYQLEKSILPNNCGVLDNKLVVNSRHHSLIVYLVVLVDKAKALPIPWNIAKSGLCLHQTNQMPLITTPKVE